MSSNLRLILFVTICRIYTISSTNQPEVTIDQGTVRGLYTKTISNKEIASFLGIPYAKSPSGKLRFKEPVPADPWIGTYDATKEPPACLQLDMFITKAIEGVEDCLRVNVYTPKLPENKQTKLLDVIVYIHGGAFYAGKSSLHGPSLLLDRDIILVTFNYRLGPLGFLSTDDDVVPGNNGMKDQVLALKWVKQNIAAFGGNPSSVTIAGSSAGGASCQYHLLSPLSKGLFKGAMCMSGVAINPWALTPSSKEKAKDIATELGCPTSDSLLMVECLREKPADLIVEATKQFVVSGMMPLLFKIVLEPPSANAFISESPIDILKQKKGSDVPILLSYNEKEGLIIGGGIITNMFIFNYVLYQWDETVPQLLDYNHIDSDDKKSEISQKIYQFYDLENGDQKENFIKMLGDRMFVSGISKAAKMAASLYTSPVYLYKFGYRGKHSITDIVFSAGEDLGVAHCDDIYYLLGFNGIHNIESESELKVSKQLLDAWVSFAANGTIEGNWQPINEQLPKLVFTDIKGPDNIELTVVDELGEENFWESLNLDQNIRPIQNHDEL